LPWAAQLAASKKGSFYKQLEFEDKIELSPKEQDKEMTLTVELYYMHASM